MATNVFDLYARLGLDSSAFEKGLSSAKSLIGNGIATAAKIGTAALTATTTAVAAVGTAAVKSYANYEQLAGGVEKLYGTAADKVKEYADQAYRTSSMSANQYMETATGFSAALIKSLGNDVDAAADMTDVAMRAISDNVNVFGSDMASVQNAFQGFAKENYTMLDNLKLGYGGTKEGMQQLIADAAKATSAQEELGLSVDATSMSFDNIIKAIQVIQKEQGIYDATAKEAMSTIEGSANATKAAWQNVITAIGRGEGLSEAFDGLITSLFGTDAETGLVNQITKRVEVVMDSIGDFIAKASPYITEKVPALISAVLPSLLNGGMELLSALGQGFMDALPDLLFMVGDIVEQILQTLVDATANGGGYILNVIDWILGVFEENYMHFMDMGLEIITNILEGMLSGETDIIYYASEIIQWLANALIEYAPTIISAAAEIILNVANGISQALPELIPVIVDVILTIIEALINNADMIIEAGINIILALIQGLLDSLPVLIQHVPTIIEAIVSALVGAIPLLINGVIQLVNAIVQALPEIIKALIDALPDIIQAIVDGLIVGLPLLIEGLVQLVLAIVAALPQILQALFQAIPQIITTIVNTIVANGPQFLEAIKSIGQSILQLLTTLGTNFLTNIKTTLSNILNNIQSFLSQLPSKMAYYAGRAIGEFIKFFLQLPSKIIGVFNTVISNVSSFGSNMINKARETAGGFATNLINGLAALPGQLIEVGRNIVEGLWNGISNGWGGLIDKVKGLADNLVQGIKDSLRIESPSKVMKWIGQMIDEGLALGITSDLGVIDDAMNSMISATEFPVSDVQIGYGTSSNRSYGQAGFVQNLTINSPRELNPSETARLTRNANREMMLKLRTV